MQAGYGDSPRASTSQERQDDPAAAPLPNLNRPRDPFDEPARAAAGAPDEAADGELLDDGSPGDSSEAATATGTKGKKGSKRGSVGAVKLDANGNPKKKRKQLVCTDTYVKNKPKIVRGGKLITQAKKLYGANAALELEGSPLEQYDDGLGESFLPTPVEQQTFSVPASPARLPTLNQLTPDAWAARFTDHVSFVGANGPTLAEVRNGAAGRDYSMIGNVRDSFARALLEKAVETVDRRAGLRTASAACCSALVLLEFLVTWDDVNRKSNTGRYLLSSACEHLRNLQLGECDDPTEPLVPPERASNGTLLWMVYTRDALGAMLGGRSCSLSEDDLDSLSDLFNSPVTADVMAYVSSTDPRMLSGLAVASIFRFCVSSVRSTVLRLTGPLARRKRLDPQVVQELWSQIDDSTRFGSIFRQSVERATFGPDAPKTDVWFRDLTAMKSQHTLGIHLALSARLREEESKEADADPDYLEMLRRLKQQSDDRLFRVSREYCHVLHNYGGDLIFSATVTPEYSAHFLEALVDTPAWEQGGAKEWTWAVKNDDVSRCIEVIQLAGWCWPGYDIAVARAQRAMKEQHILLAQRGVVHIQPYVAAESMRSSFSTPGAGSGPYRPPMSWPPRPVHPESQHEYTAYPLEPTRSFVSEPDRPAPFTTIGPLSSTLPPPSHGSPPPPPFLPPAHSLAPMRGAPQQHPQQQQLPSHSQQHLAYHTNAEDGMRLPSLSSYHTSSSGSGRASLPPVSAFAQAPPPPP
ncbi:hypothetical protein JCM8202v2_002549 [Rhodotorula sphaerocarpa]